ncbi:MAG: hypothetical protein WDO56_00160 [Gammaproteobacteria bacterium]
MNAVRLEYDDVKNAFSRVLKALRTVAGASEQEFAACLGMETHDYIAYEGGKWGCQPVQRARHRAAAERSAGNAPECDGELHVPAASARHRAASRSVTCTGLAGVDAQGVVHESGHAAYDSIDQACAPISPRKTRCARRKAQGLPPLTRISAYARLGRMMVSGKEDACVQGPSSAG